jgi:hypothetical protein
MRAAQAAREALRRHPGAQVTIVSTFPPLGTHLAGWQLARQTRFPWIADFRDPMAAPGFEDLVRPFQFRLARFLEPKVLASSSAVIANTDSAAAAWIQRQPTLKNKIYVVWNGFDPEKHITAMPAPKRGYKLLSHAGELYHGRTVAKVLESIDRLITAGNLSPRQFRVRLVGPASKDSLPSPDLVTRGRQAGWLELHLEMVPQAEARQLTQTSDALLLVQPQTRLQVPGKLFEYLQIGRPILAFILSGSPIERILEKSGVPYRCVYADSSVEAFEEAVLSFASLPSDSVPASVWFEENFSAERQTQTLHAIIQSLHPPQS